MRYSVVLFIIYRIINKVFGLRIEQKLGYFIFNLVAKKNKIHPSYNLATITDKRSLWGTLRIDNEKEDLRENLQKSLGYGEISFENSMETSIRGINLILRYEKLAIDRFKEKLIKQYLSACFLHVFLCPDLFIKRKGFKLNDESNNHRFYNLLFFVFVSIFWRKKCKTKKLEKFVKDRIENKFLFDEGSTFYHFGVVDAICKLQKYAFYKNVDLNFGKSFLLWIETAKMKNSTMGRLNFGDRDGTIINPSDSSHTDDKQTWKLHDSEKLYVSKRGLSLFAVRKNNWCNIGTQGHVHDDFGHIVFKNKSIMIHDVGTYKYQSEPKYALKKYHNFPRSSQSKQIFYKSKFDRIIPRNKKVCENLFSLELSEVCNSHELKRVINKKDLNIYDKILCNEESSAIIHWRFFISGGVQIDGKNKFLVGDTCNFKFYEPIKFKLGQGYYFPNYGQIAKCEVLIVHMYLKLQEHAETDLLKIQFEEGNL